MENLEDAFASLTAGVGGRSLKGSELAAYDGLFIVMGVGKFLSQFGDRPVTRVNVSNVILERPGGSYQLLLRAAALQGQGSGVSFTVIKTENGELGVDMHDA